MAATYGLFGARLNHIERAVLAPVMSPAADSLFPVAGLYDRLPGIPARWGSAAADPKSTVDLNMTVNGGMEQTPIESNGWTITGAVVGSATSRSGANAASIPSGGSISQDHICRSGEKIHVEVWTRQVTGGSGTGTVTVECRETGKFWNGSAWAASGNIGTNTGAVYVKIESDPVLEGLDVTLLPLVTIRVTVTCTGGGGNTLADDAAVWPWWDWCSVHGHKYLDPRLVVTLRSSTDNFGASDTPEATLTIAQPSFWTRLAALNGRRYVQLRATGTPRAAAFIGEVVIGQSYSLAPLPAHPRRIPWPFSERRPQIRNATQGGNVYVSQLAQASMTRLELTFTHMLEAEFNAFHREISERSEQGTYPAILVPDSAQARVLFGLIDDEMAFQRTAAGLYVTTLAITELGTLTAGL